MKSSSIENPSNGNSGAATRDAFTERESPRRRAASHAPRRSRRAPALRRRASPRADHGKPPPSRGDGPAALHVAAERRSPTGAVARAATLADRRDSRGDARQIPAAPRRGARGERDGRTRHCRVRSARRARRRGPSYRPPPTTQAGFGLASSSFRSVFRSV
jgi:hypothetical protein